ncbi:hypothetical protein HORIV_13290 [Vreelandella olivaria]|uniref:Major facilitator superfamily (MFS) profile domain-containing protein n=1 Tax=Vreelandella olivaria TaxID=390919 RepID=A0ABM7GEV9_9GAMM|nr:hypothetical protein HORIV_13290 [Halomonas olivaria]
MADQSRLSVYLIALGAFALGMASYVTAGLIPLIGDAFSVSDATAAQLVTAFTLAYGLGSPVVVALLPGHRQRLGLLLALAVFIVANIASALATNFVSLAVWRAVAGVGAGFILPWALPLQPPSRQRPSAVKRLPSSWAAWRAARYWGAYQPVAG